MNLTQFANLYVIAAAPVVEPAAPLSIEVTSEGRQTARHIKYNRQSLAERMGIIQPRGIAEWAQDDNRS